MLEQTLSPEEQEELKGKFPFFWWESNQCWGYVTSTEAIQWINDHYKESCAGRIDVLSAKAASLGDELTPPNFGLRMEHKGAVTLGEFLKENKVDVSHLKLDTGL